MDPDLRTRPPAPWIAVSLGLLCPGLGQMYCGRFRRGLVFLLLALLLGPNLLWVVAQPPASSVVGAMLVSVLLAVGVLVVSVVDAARLARKLRRAGELGPALGPGLAVLCVLVGIVAPTAAALVLRATTMEAFRIAGESMAPGLHSGDRVLVDKVGLRYGLPGRGQVIVFRTSGGRAFIKRVIAVEGDRVEMTGTGVRLNGLRLGAEPVEINFSEGEDPGTRIERAGDRTYPILVPPAGDESGSGSWTVPPGHVFVLGDNRGASEDSRQLGPVARSDIVGVVSCLFWPPARFGDAVR